MTDIALRIAHRQKMFRRAVSGLVLALLSPLTVFLASAGLKAGVLPIETAFDLLTMKAALGLAVIGVIGAGSGLIAGLSAFRSAGGFAVAAVLVSAATVGVFGWTLFQSEPAQGDVSTDAADPPGFAGGVVAERAATGADPLPTQTGPGACQVTALPTQVAPGVAGYGLGSAGFTVRGMGVGRGDGVWTSFWFNRTYDAVVRIRPGRTDVRVTARDLGHDRGEACRLARKVVQGMRA